MNYDITPTVTRLIPFKNEGGALAAVDVNFGPVMIRAKLYHNSGGYYLMWPGRKAESGEKWYDLVAIADPVLRLKAQQVAGKSYEVLSEGELVAV